MKTIACICFATLITSCGPSSTPTTDAAPPTTNTVTTVTTTTPAAPVTPAVPAIGLTQVNLDRVQNDMSAAEVEAILGQPTSSQSQPIPIVGGTQTTYSYQGGTSAVTIVFKNDQVKTKSGTFGP